MSDEIQRTVAIFLKLAADPASAAAAKQVAEQIENAQKRAQSATSKASAQARSEAKKQADEQKKAIEEVQRAQQRAAALADAAAKQIFSAQANILNQTKLIGSGVLSLAQGMAVLGISGEENLEKFAKAFVKINAGFQVLRGGIDIIVGVAQNMRMLTEVTAAYAVRQAALQTMQAGVIPVAGTAAASAGGSALGAGLAGAGGAGAVTFGGALKGALASAAGPAATAAGGAIGGLALFEGVQAVRRLASGVKEAEGETESFTMALVRWRQAASEASASTERLAEAEAKRQRRIEERALTIEHAQVMTGIAQRREAALGGIALQRAAAAGASPLEQANLGVSLAQQQMASARQRLEESKLIEQQAGALERMLATNERLVDAERARADLMKRNVELARQEAEAVSQRINQELQSRRAGAVRFGQLDPQAQQALKGIGEKLQAGQELQRRDIEILQQTGFGMQHVERFFAQRGVEAGAVPTLKALGDFSDLEQLRRQEEEALQRMKDAQRDAAESTDRLTQAMDSLAETIERLANIQIEQEQARFNQARPGLTEQQWQRLEGPSTGFFSGLFQRGLPGGQSGFFDIF